MSIVDGYISYLMTVNTDVASSLFHPRIECSWDFYNMQFVYKSILSPFYDLYYESGLHRCVLNDEMNKTRSHLHIILKCFALVATYI